MTTLPVKPLLQALALAEKLAHKDSRNARLDFLDEGVLRVTGQGDVIHSEHRMAFVGDPLPAFAIQRKDFAAVLKKCGDEAPASMDGSRLAIGKGKTKYRLDTAPPETVAELPDPAEVAFAATCNAVLQLTGKEWQERLTPLLPTIGDDGYKPHFKGVLFDEERLVSSDGFRFSLLEQPSLAAGRSPFVLPAAAVEFILNLAKAGGDAPIKLYGAGPFEVEAEGVRGLCPGIESKYPPYKMIIPLDAAWWFEAKAGAFLEALREVTLLSGGRTAPVSIQMAEGNVGLGVVGDGGEAGGGFTPDTVGGMAAPTPIKLNWSFLADALSVLDPEATVTLSASTSFRPVVLTGKTLSGLSHRSLVMPLR